MAHICSVNRRTLANKEELFCKLSSNSGSMELGIDVNSHYPDVYPDNVDPAWEHFCNISSRVCRGTIWGGYSQPAVRFEFILKIVTTFAELVSNGMTSFNVTYQRIVCVKCVPCFFYVSGGWRVITETVIHQLLQNAILNCWRPSAIRVGCLCVLFPFSKMTQGNHWKLMWIITTLHTTVTKIQQEI